MNTITGWVSVSPPIGYRLLSGSEPIQHGDLVLTTISTGQSVWCMMPKHAPRIVGATYARCEHGAFALCPPLRWDGESELEHNQRCGLWSSRDQNGSRRDGN